jgi:hypothetical protein
MSEIPSETKTDPWETPSANLDPDLVETSRRLVAKSEATYPQPESLPNSEVDSVPDPKIVELEAQNTYLLDRNANLVAKVAQLEAVNSQLQEKISNLQNSRQPHRPWYLRWLG